MTGRISILAMAVAAFLAVASAVYAVDEIHQGKVITVAKGMIVLLDDRDGDNDKIAVTAETTITRNGKPAKLIDVRPGDRAKVVAVSMGLELVAKSIAATAPE